MIRRLLLAVAIVIAVLGFFVDAAPALAPEAQGWWWVASPGGPVGVPSPPWVPPDGLYVASNPQGAEAFSAVRFTLPAGATASSLTLEVADARGDPFVAICPTTTDWAPVQGGSMSDAPEYDCEAGAAAGALDAEGATVTFPVSALGAGGSGGGGALDVAIVPTTDESGGTPTFQLALAKPGDNALSVTQSSGGGSGATPTTTTVAPPPAEEAPPEVDPAPAAPPAPSTPPPSSSPLVGSSSRPAGSPASGSGSSPSSPIAPAASVPGDGDDDGSQRLKFIGYGAVAAAAYLYHRLSRVADRAPKSLISFGRVLGEGEEPASP